MAIPKWLKKAVDTVTGDTASTVAKAKAEREKKMREAGIRPSPRTSYQTQNEKLKKNKANGL